ncbi:uncharacterized protein LODBEIA_P60760 [Lodderomyces beijingensis]|uniref:Aldehyde dehydrogenase domain-containing protein n=1 Tax=Lodderomyces beijingensis TaxID=1775926 RepID=A0ABP0ZX48_9ASCO
MNNTNSKLPNTPIKPIYKKSSPRSTKASKSTIATPKLQEIPDPLSGRSSSPESPSRSKSRRASPASVKSQQSSTSNNTRDKMAEKATSSTLNGSQKPEESAVLVEREEATTKTAQTAIDTSFYTNVADIEPGVARVTQGFRSGKTHSIQFRLNQLRNLYFAIKKNEQELVSALNQDFDRIPSETRNYEILTGLNELVYIMSQLHKWAKPEPVSDLPLNLSTNPIYVERIPLGVVLVIAAYNYPFFVSISPIVGAIAAGNAVVLKQSELTPNFTKAFTRVVTQALDKDIFFVVNGAIAETTALLDQKVDKIIFTGSETVGKVIARKAAETLTPVILELGGKSPAIILEDAEPKDLAVIARRIAWGRFTNAGQTCIGVDYVLVPEHLHSQFVATLKKILTEEFYPGLTKNDPQFTHLIHDRAFQNLIKMIEATKGNVVTGGSPKSDAASRFIPPTVIDNATWDDSSMAREIFGPVLPIVTYSNLNDACSQVVKNCDTPLALYVFTCGATSSDKNPAIKTIKSTIRSGGLVINDVLMHIALHNAPFGGVGSSGYGAYHGQFSFRELSHERTVMEQYLWNDWVIKSRYPPYSDKKDALVQTSQKPYGGRVWFGRKGDVRVEGPTLTFTAWSNALGLFTLARDFIGNAI